MTPTFITRWRETAAVLREDAKSSPAQAPALRAAADALDTAATDAASRHNLEMARIFSAKS